MHKRYFCPPFMWIHKSFQSGKHGTFSFVFNRDEKIIEPMCATNANVATNKQTIKQASEQTNKQTNKQMHKRTECKNARNIRTH